MTGAAKLRIDDKKNGRKRPRQDGGGDSAEGGVRSGFRPPKRPGEAAAEPAADEEEELDPRYKNIDPKYIEQIQNEVLESAPEVQWDDIAGLAFAKKCVTEMVIFPIMRPDIFHGLRGPPKGLLLFGPPGTVDWNRRAFPRVCPCPRTADAELCRCPQGKTLICKAIAAQSKSTFFSISASTMTSKWMGEGEKLVRALFAVARVEAPSVIFIDEIDSLLTARSEGEVRRAAQPQPAAQRGFSCVHLLFVCGVQYEGTRRIKTEFLVQWDGAGTTDTDRLLVVGATNRPADLDEAARRRLVKRLYIPLPDEEARRDLVCRLLESNNSAHQLAEADIDSIVARSRGYSGADMANLCKEAAMGPVRRISPDDMASIDVNDVDPILPGDFDAAFAQVRASVSSADLASLVQWDRQFGSASQLSEQDAKEAGVPGDAKAGAEPAPK